MKSGFNTAITGGTGVGTGSGLDDLLQALKAVI
jgi:hypothetical protein